MSSSPASHEDFSDLKSHQNMWGGFTHLLFRGTVGVVVIVLIIGFITGVL
jgi:hypothetical protein